MMFKKFVFVLLISFFAISLYAYDAPVAKIEDDSSLRAILKEKWFLEAPNRVIALKPLLYTLPGGDKIEVRVESNKNEFGIVLARERNKAYPGWAQGSWALVRRRDTGASVRIRAFLRSDPNVYVQFRPMTADKSVMDVVVYDAYLVYSLPTPFSFDKLLTLPVEDALSAIGDKFPRAYFEPTPALYKDTWKFVADVQKHLSGLTFRDDGAIDEAGNYVFIETGERQSGTPGLNCSGFAKWVIDGLLRPVTGERLSIEPLKAHYGNRGNSFTALYDDTRDPFFGLDWIRNLAAVAGSTLLSPACGTLDEFEVRTWRFPSLMRRSNAGVAGATESYAGFMEDAGFNIEGIYPLLYTLAIDEPDRFYLAAVNDASGPRPSLRQYFHVAILAPYFNEQGNFEIAVFESAAETTFRSFRTRYPKDTFVNLVRIPVGNQFEP
ncbi:MAG: hypothetical protein LBL45_11485 [Treponema sp.]|jgi:hypothetical protein|nr:hypothetical protein [Treponema sp.]